MARALTVSLILTSAACTGGANDTAPPATASPTGTTSTSSTTIPATTSTSLVAEPSTELYWWNDRVFYEVFVRSFKDSDGDGVGDLAGLTASLDYLNDGDPSTTDDLGVTGLWLMPIFPSPSYHGYDVTDYRSINPDYGTMADFERFLAAAHDRGIAVVIDLVINHTSIDHPWFTASTERDPDHRDWYRWSASDPGTTAPWGAPAWHYRRGEYFFGLFWEGMPDLNLEHPDVTAELHDIARFWLEDVGVDGFRLDAARHLIEDGDVVSDTAATVGWLEEFNAYVDSIAPEALVLGEVWSPTADVATYVPEALDLAFEFELAESGGAALAARDASILERSLATVVDSYPPLQYATFLTNHDMDRIMSSVGGDVRPARLAATFLLTAPGVPFLYYGEEIGLQGTKPDERIRTPMPWSDEDERVGFTTGTAWEPPDPGFTDANVADQLDDPDSLLSHYRTLIHARAASTALSHGEIVPVDSDSETVAAFLRSHGDEHVLVVLNLSADPVVDPELHLAIGPVAGYAGVEAVVGPPAWAPEVHGDGGFDRYRPLESLPPYGFLVLRLTRAPSPPPPSTVPPTTTTLAPTPVADVAAVEELLDAVASGDLERAIATLAPDAVYVEQPDVAIRFDQPLPDEAGVDESWDWNDDGVVTLADVTAAQNAWAAVTLTNFDVECSGTGDLVTCDIVQADVFGEAAGLEPAEIRQTFRVAGGRISEVWADERPGRTEQLEIAWLEQFAAYEQWVADTEPGLYPMVFRGPCCTGTPDGMWLTRGSIDLQRDLIARWVASGG